jgi:hypothetical protein
MLMMAKHEVAIGEIVLADGLRAGDHASQVHGPRRFGYVRLRSIAAVNS